jgi:cytochrome c oxidase subunit IV
MASEEGQQHPLKIYYIMWVALFVLSGFSYWTDFWDDGPLRTAAILTLMMLKAGGIVWIFMHMGWEREGDYIEGSRLEHYGESTMEVVTPEHH